MRNPELEKPISPYASRKFLFSSMVFLVDTALLIGGLITGTIWGQVSVGVVMAYLTGNVAEGFLDKKK